MPLSLTTSYLGLYLDYLLLLFVPVRYTIRNRVYSIKEVAVRLYSLFITSSRHIKLGDIKLFLDLPLAYTSPRKLRR
jgi:hypothetical protein